MDENSSGMQVVHAEPHPLLRPYVREYEGYETDGEARRDVHVAYPGVPLIISFRQDPMLIAPSRPGDKVEVRRSFVAGLHDTFSTGESPGRMCGVQVNFTPIGGYLVMGMPMHELTNRTVAIDDVFGKEGPRLVERLAEETDWGARYSTLDSFIGRRIAAANRPPTGIIWAWRRLDETGGRVTVGELADELGMSRKHLVASFRKYVGLPPKVVSRILRFDRARSGIADGKGWSEIAHEAGYYDQAHLIRDFRQFTGFTPSGYTARLAEHGGVLID